MEDEQKNQPEQQVRPKRKRRTLSQEEAIRKLKDCILGGPSKKPEKILVDGRYVPELDPDSGEFDPEKYAEAEREERRQKSKRTEECRRELAFAVLKAVRSTDSYKQTGPVTMKQLIRLFVNEISFDDRSEIAKLVNIFLNDVKNESFRKTMLSRIPAMQFLSAELKKPEYGGKNLHELFSEGTEDSNLKVKKILSKSRQHALSSAVLPLLRSSGTPKYYTSPNTTLANALQAIDGKPEVIGAGPTDLPVMNIGKPGEVTIYVNASLDNMEGIKITGKPYTEYDRAVHDAVVSLFIDCQKKGQMPVMTPDMVYRTMTHKTATEYVSQQQRDAVIQSIDKMRRNISVYADASAEFRRRGITMNGKPVEKFVRDGSLLPAERLQVKAGGESVDAFVIKGTPLLLDYAMLTGQLITVKGNMLDIREVEDNKVTDISLPNNENRIAIKSYLLRRVECMRSDEQKAAKAAVSYEKKRTSENSLPPKPVASFRKHGRIILLEKVFEAAGITHRNTKTRSRNYICQILDYWKASGYITGYELRKSGRTADAIIIDVQG